MPTRSQLLEAERQSREAVLRHLYSYQIIMEASGEPTALQLRDTRRSRFRRQNFATNPNDPYEVQWASNRWARRTPRTLGHPIYRVSAPNQGSNPFGDEHAAENFLVDGMMLAGRGYSPFDPGAAVERDVERPIFGSADRPNNGRRGAIASGSPPARPQTPPPESEYRDPNVSRPLWERARRQSQNGEVVQPQPQPQPYDQVIGRQEMSDVLRMELDNTVERLAERAERELDHRRANVFRTHWHLLAPEQEVIIDRQIYEDLAEDMNRYMSVLHQLPAPIHL